MKILFVWPEYRITGFKSISISLLSGILRQEGHETKLFDTSLYDIPISGRDDDKDTAEDLMLFPRADLPMNNETMHRKNFILSFNNILSEYMPDIVAFSSSTLPYILVEKLVKGIDIERRPALAIGGIHTLFNTEKIVNSNMFDYIVLGDGEAAILEIIEHLKGERKVSKLHNVIVREDDEWISNKPAPLIPDLDKLPFYDWSIFDNEYHFWRPYQGVVYRMGDYMTARGCTYKCSFCFYDNYFKFYNTEKRMRYHSPERCVSELGELSTRYNIKFWKFHDSDFFLRKEEEFGELMELYKTRIDLPFVCLTNANTITREKIKMVKDAKCKSITIGIESGSEKIRKGVLKKNVSNDRIVESVKIIKEAGMRVATSNMIGLPEETEGDIRETIKLNRLVASDLADVNYFYPFCGTELGDECYQNGYVKDHSQELVSIRNSYVMEMPQISLETLEGLHRTFQLYMNLPEYLDPLIRLAEDHDNTGNKVFEILHDIVMDKLNE